jgi:hypothetical protein
MEVMHNGGHAGATHGGILFLLPLFVEVLFFFFFFFGILAKKLSSEV